MVSFSSFEGGTTNRLEELDQFGLQGGTTNRLEELDQFGLQGGTTNRLEELDQFCCKPSMPKILGIIPHVNESYKLILYTCYPHPVMYILYANHSWFLQGMLIIYYCTSSVISDHTAETSAPKLVEINKNFERYRYEKQMLPR
jgi:hypothetical protein